MILPTKHIPTNQSLLGVGALLLKKMKRPGTVTTPWEKVRENPEIGSFKRFSLALDFLYAIGAIELAEGLLRRIES